MGILQVDVAGREDPLLADKNKQKTSLIRMYKKYITTYPSDNKSTLYISEHIISLFSFVSQSTVRSYVTMQYCRCIYISFSVSEVHCYIRIPAWPHSKQIRMARLELFGGSTIT